MNVKEDENNVTREWHNAKIKIKSKQMKMKKIVNYEFIVFIINYKKFNNLSKLNAIILTGAYLILNFLIRLISFLFL